MVAAISRGARQKHRRAPLLFAAAALLGGSGAYAAAATPGLSVAQVMGGRNPSGWACFYRQVSFAGTRWCLGAGTLRSHLPPEWRATISSIRVSPGTVVRICTAPHLGGECRFVNQDESILGSVDNAIRSFAVYGSDPRAL